VVIAALKRIFAAAEPCGALCQEVRRERQDMALSQQFQALSKRGASPYKHETIRR